MKRILVIFLTFMSLFLQNAICAQQSPPRYREQEISPSGDMVIEYRYDYAKEHHEVWLKSIEDTLSPVFLYEFSRDAKVMVSPDEQWLIINNHMGSDISEVILFRKTTALKFTELKTRNISGKSWQFFCRKNKITELTFHHQYAECLMWSSDSRYLLLKLSGYENGSNYADSWLCIYDIEKDAFSTDLSQMNRKAVKVE
ncbi:MAG: hypothetical protein ACM3SM_04365 [Bacteroidota bacterium]